MEKNMSLESHHITQISYFSLNFTLLNKKSLSRGEQKKYNKIGYQTQHF